MKKKFITFAVFLFLTSSILLYLLIIEPGNKVVDSADEKGHEQVLILYQNYCLRCHGELEEGEKNVSGENGMQYSIGEIKDIIHDGGYYMPGFPDIEEPLLTELAKYIKTLENF